MHKESNGSADWSLRSKALRLRSRRALPQRKTTLVDFQLPAVQTPADSPLAADAVLQAIAHGEITSADGQQMIGLLDLFRVNLFTTDFDKRLQSLEERDRAREQTPGPPFRNRKARPGVRLPSEMRTPSFHPRTPLVSAIGPIPRLEVAHALISVKWGIHFTQVTPIACGRLSAASA